jgi:serine protease Do
MERMIIKHLSGSKANQTEEFALRHHSSLIFGREASATIKYDPDRDDLVGREHARIEIDPGDANAFLLTDLNSRNGTFLNNRRISGTVKLAPGDEVQFGPGGPKFQFDVEPRPHNSTKATRIAETASPTPMTRVVETSATPSEIISPQTAGKATVGKATVERMISHNVAETRQQERSNFAKIGAAAAVTVLLLFGVVIGGAYWYNSSQKKELQDQMVSQSEDANKKSDELQRKLDEEKANAPKAASEIAEKFSKAVVYITGSWQLVNSESKSQIYHQFIPNRREALSQIVKKDLGKGEIIPDGPSAIPVYLQVGESYEPVLTDEKSSLSLAIGMSGYSGSGFIVTNDGYILTNKHVAAPWRANYSFPEGYPLGVLFTSDGQLQVVKPPQDWIPENTKAVPVQFQGKFEGNNKLRVQLAGSENPIDAQFIQASPRHDVGMIKLSLPGNFTKVELFDNYDSLKKGEGLIVMGYPGSAPKVFSEIRSQDMLSPGTKYSIIPDPTVTTTSVGNIVRNSEANDPNKRISIGGDSIRYAVGLTGSGNSGGPVFDMQGRVIGIHYAGDGVQSGFAVPIRYGKELFPGN